MARILAIVLSSLLALALALTVSAAGFCAETEYLNMVTDKVEDLEPHIFKLFGTHPRSLEFAEFARRHDKKYDTVHQLVHRYNTFVNNAELIESRNSKKLPYTLGTNKFADMTWEEFQGKHLGASQDCSATKSKHKLTYAQAPEKVIQ